MKNPVGATSSLIATLMLAACNHNPSTAQTDVATANAVPAAPVEATLDWYRDAKFGMMITWGLFSTGDHEWVRYRNKIPDTEYRARKDSFDPQKFDADAWARTASEAGMKYIVLIAKHHDGFAIFRSDADDFAIQSTPFGETGRDPVMELAEACRTYGLKLGFYYSQYQDWDHPGGGSIDLSYEGFADRPYEDYIHGKAIPQVRELLTKYGDALMIWFDTSAQSSEQDAELFRDTVRETSPGTIVGGRVGHGLGDFWSLPDGAAGKLPFSEPWETVKHTGLGWSWHRPDDDSKLNSVYTHYNEQMTGADVVHALLRTISRGGNLLLNAGPSIDGEMRPEDVSAFKEAGQWLAVNGEAVYGTTMTPWLSDPVLATTRPGKIYVYLLETPEGNELVLPALENDVLSAYMLADETESDLPVAQSDNAVTVSLGERATDPIASVLVLEIDGNAIVEDDAVPHADAEGIIRIEAQDINLVDDRFTRRNEQQDSIEILNTRRAWQNGAYRIDEPGTYRLLVDQAGTGDARYFIRTHDTKFDVTVDDTGDLSSFGKKLVGTVRFDEPGIYNFTLRPWQWFLETDEVLMSLRSLELVPE